MVTVKSKAVKTLRPPNLSVKMPSGMLTAAAKKGSIAARTSTWVALKSYHLIRNGASAENIPQTAKPSENARDDIHKTLGLPGGSAVTSTSTMGVLTSTTGTAAPENDKSNHFECPLVALALRIRLRFLILIVRARGTRHAAILLRMGRFSRRTIGRSR